MILGIGNDLCDIRRVKAALEKFGDRFETRCFTAGERAMAAGRADKAGTLAKRFAAKEACSKALGTGIRGFHWHDLEVINLLLGQPAMKLTGLARERLEAITPEGYEAVVHVSLTDEAQFAQAFVLIEARPK